MEREQVIAWLLNNEIQFDKKANTRQLEKFAKDHGAQFDIMETAIKAAETDEQPLAAVQALQISDEIDNLKQIQEEQAIVEPEIELIQKKKTLENLRRTSSRNRAEVDHVMTAIFPFSGEHVADVRKWLSDFERTCDTMDGDDIFKLKCIRRLMKPGSNAGWFLRVDQSTSYNEFRQQFLETFGRSHSVVEVVTLPKSTVFSNSIQPTYFKCRRLRQEHRSRNLRSCN